MKSLMPWVCLIATASSSMAHGSPDGLDAYREGHYWQAANALTAESSLDPIVDYYLGRMRLYGYGELKNNALAIRDFKRSAERGFLPAQRVMARVALNRDHDPEQALFWFKKAADANDLKSQMYCAAAYRVGLGTKKNEDMARRYVIAAAKNGNALAQFTLAENFLASRQEASKRLGLLWLEKAVEKQNPAAELLLGQLYAAGTLVSVDLEKSKTLIDLATQHGHAPVLVTVKPATVPEQERSVSPEEAAARWLTDNKETTLWASGYGLHGILSAWQSIPAREENNYNQAPQMEETSRASLYTPHFVMTHPNDIPLIDYFDAAVQSESDVPQKAWDFPRYPLTQKAVTPRLTEKAALGDSTAQFELGQLYQQGVGVNKDIALAIKYYGEASAQQDLRAEYNLGLLYLEGEAGKPDYRQAVGWLNDAAFKGNPNAQYVLGQVSERGYRDAAGVEVLPQDHEQAIAMYYLGAANHHGLSQYRLATCLSHEHDRTLTVAQKQKRDALMRTLYQSAASAGVLPATLPLAFFHAMTADKAEQASAFDVANKEAEAGNPHAALLLGLLFDRGIGVKASASDAVHWYKKAAQSPVSAFILGTYAALGTGVSRDLDQSRTLLKQASASGFSYAPLNLAILDKQEGTDFLPGLLQAHGLSNSTASLLLADYYLTLGDDATQMKQARDIYQQLADKGDREGQLKLGYMFEQGLGGVVDVLQAAVWYEQAATQGQAVAQYRLGRLNQLGWLSKAPDYDVAKKWYTTAMASYSPAAVALGFIQDTVDDDYRQATLNYERAALLGDAVAQFDLGLIYEKGKGIPVQINKAEALYRASAEQGHAQAMVQLAGLYLNGLTGSRDETQALSWYQKAAKKGDREALYQLGLLAETGVGVTLDCPQAVQFYQAAAGKGNAKAMLALARMYQYGQGLPKNNVEAVTLYKELASMGNAYAAYQLAGLAYEGALGEKNVRQAQQWLHLAVDNGSQQASRVLLWLNAKADIRVSFIEPLTFTTAGTVIEAPVHWMYLGALSEWNQGNVVGSRMMLSQLLSEYPNYGPAQEAYNYLRDPGLWDQSRT